MGDEMLPKFDYYLDESDPDIFVLRRQDGAFVANFYEKALFVKPTWRLLLEAECNGFECPSRYASIRTSEEPHSLWWLCAFDEIRLDSGY